MQYNDVMIHSDDECNHLYLNIQLKWQKVNEYYDKLDDLAVYVAAFLLHPRYWLVKLKSLWLSKTDWIETAEKVFKQLWQYYKELNIGKKPIQPPTKQQSRANFLEEFLSDEDDYTELCEPDWKQKLASKESYSQLDKMEEFQSTSNLIFTTVRDPIQFWVQHQGQ